MSTLCIKAMSVREMWHKNLLLPALKLEQKDCVTQVGSMPRSLEESSPSTLRKQIPSSYKCIELGSSSNLAEKKIIFRIYIIFIVIRFIGSIQIYTMLTSIQGTWTCLYMIYLSFSFSFSSPPFNSAPSFIHKVCFHFTPFSHPLHSF